MPKKISAEMRSRLLNQKKEMGSGLVIENKGFTKMKLRVIPISTDVPGVENISFFSESLKKGTTSPRTFGLKCPVMDALDTIRRGEDKDLKEFAKGFVNISREYWMGVVDQDDKGTPESVGIRILRAKRSIYEEIIAYMCDEDDGEDITDPQEGRDIRIKKEGSGMDTVWTVKFLDRGPVSTDKAYVDAFMEAAAKFDVKDHFFKVDYKTLGEIYEGLMDAPIPESYLEGINTASTKGGKSSPSPRSFKPSKSVAQVEVAENVVETEDDDQPVLSAPAKAPLRKAPPPPVEEEVNESTEDTATRPEVWEAGNLVQFDDGSGNMVAGELLKDNGDGTWDVKDGSDEVWGVNEGDLQIYTPVEEAPEPPPVKAPLKKSPAKPAATAAKPTAQAPAPAATAGLPRKPGLAKASGTLKARLAKAQ